MGTLEAFEGDVAHTLAVGDVAPCTPVVSDDGQRHIVCALDTEPLRVLVERVARVGGYANVFVRDETQMFALSCVSASDTGDPDSAADLTGIDRCLSPTASVGMLLDQLTGSRHGIHIPALPDTAHPRSIHITLIGAVATV